MPIEFEPIKYGVLNSRQQEAYNFQKVSAVLADFGFVTIPLSNDWNGADFLLQTHDGKTFYKVQLKSRLTFDKKYKDEELYVCFRDGESGSWYMYNHAELLKKVQEVCKIKIEQSRTWENNKPYHFPTLSAKLVELLKDYKIPAKD
ncbi:MAG: hypothetical protein WCA21_17815 [Terracidiphilus sp.]